MDLGRLLGLPSRSAVLPRGLGSDSFECSDGVSIARAVRALERHVMECLDTLDRGMHLLTGRVVGSLV